MALTAQQKKDLAAAKKNLDAQVKSKAISKAQRDAEYARLEGIARSGGDINAPQNPPAPVPTGPLTTTGQNVDLQGAAASLRQQVADGLITPDQANAQLRNLSLQNASNALQAQVGQPGGPTQEAVNAEFQRLAALPTATLIAQTVTAAPIQTAYDASVNKPGTKTDGTDLGDVREINPSQINPTPLATVARIDPVLNAQADAQTLAQQQAFVQALQQQAAGQGPSLAGLQLQQALERGLKNQMGALASNPGISAALAARLFGQQTAAAQRDAAMASAQTRIQEQNAAQQQLGTALNQVQDVQTRVALANQLAGNTQNYNQAQLEQEIAKANAAQLAAKAKDQATLNQNAALANQGAFNQSNLAQGQIAGGIEQAGIQAAATEAAAAAAAAATEGAANTNADAAVTIAGLNNANSTSPTTNGPTSDDTLPGPGQQNGGNQSVVGSDERMKKNIGDGSGDARNMMKELAAAIFEYKNKQNGDGKQVGVMAQDLEKSDLGSQMVEEKGGKKWINFAKGLGAVLAAQADLNKRMEHAGI